MLKVYYTRVSDLPENAEGLPLSEYRKAKLAACRNGRMRKQYLGAELLLLWALKQEDVCPLPPVISVLPGGQPALVNVPLQFSLSHSGDLAACALSDRPVGLDLEREGRYRESLLRRCFSPEEQKWIGENKEPGAAFTRLWTGKESILKLRGTGIREDLARVSPLSQGPGLRIWHTRIPGCTDDEMIQTADGTRYQLSVCFDAAMEEPKGLRFVAAGTLMEAFSDGMEKMR